MKNSKYCNYYAESDNVTYIPDCCVEDGEVVNDVHPQDAAEWDYCPFCGRKIKYKDNTSHPELYDEDM